MAVNLTLGFQDQYSAGFQQLTAEMEKQEQAARDLADANKGHNESLRQMTTQHKDVTRAMITGKEATGSLVVPMSKLKDETKGFALSSDQARQAMGAIAGPLAGMPIKVAAIVAAFKGLQLAYRGITSNQTVNDHIKDTANNLFGLDKAWKQLKKDVGPGIEDLREARDAMLGINSESRRLSEELQKQAKHWQALREARGNVEKERKAEMDLRELRKIITKEGIDQEIQAEREKFAKLATARKKDEDAIAKSRDRITDLIRRSHEIEDELEQKRIENARKAAEREVEIRRNAAEKEKQIREQQLAEETRMREEAAEKEKRIREAYEEGERGVLTDLNRQHEEYWKHRLSFREGQEEKILKIEQDAAKERHELALRAAKSEEDAIRAGYDLRRELLEIEHRHTMEAEAKKVEVSRKAAEAKVQAERDRIEKIKALTDKEGKNLYQQQIAKQSPQQVAEEIVRRRFAEAKQDRPEMGREAQTRLMRGLRMQVGRDLRGGKISEEEISRVQRDLAANQILAGNKAGKFSQETMKSFSEQARAFADQARFNEEMANQQREFQAFMKQAQGQTQGQTERARAQRRAMRG